MIEMQRTPARILKNREVQAGETPLPALAPLEPAAKTPTPAPRTSPVPAPARCVTKEARLVPGENGANAIEVRCSCGEWTRIELQVGAGETR